MRRAEEGEEEGGRKEGKIGDREESKKKRGREGEEPEAGRKGKK